MRTQFVPDVVDATDKKQILVAARSQIANLTRVGIFCFVKLWHLHVVWHACYIRVCADYGKYYLDELGRMLQSRILLPP